MTPAPWPIDPHGRPVPFGDLPTELSLALWRAAAALTVARLADTPLRAAAALLLLPQARQ